MFVCPVCFNKNTFHDIRRDKLVSDNKLHCTNCNSARPVEIDDGIADQISIFWKNGIKTQFCCSGHPYDVNRPYILFKSDSLKKLMVFREKILELIEPNIIANEIEDCISNGKAARIQLMGYDNLDDNNFRFNLEFDSSLYFAETRKRIRNYYIAEYANFLYKIIDTMGIE